MSQADHQFVQIPELSNPALCPARALRDLFKSKKIPSNVLLFADKSYPHLPVIDTKIRNPHIEVLRGLGIPITGDVFHIFCHSGKTLAFANRVQLEYLMAYGVWHSYAVWAYLQNSS